MKASLNNFIVLEYPHFIWFHSTWNENKRLRIHSDWSWWVSGSPRTTQHNLWSRLSVRQLNIGVAQRAQVTMFLRETEGRCWSRYWPRTILCWWCRCQGPGIRWRLRARGWSRGRLAWPSWRAAMTSLTRSTNSETCKIKTWYHKNCVTFFNFSNASAHLSLWLKWDGCGLWKASFVPSLF